METKTMTNTDTAIDARAVYTSFTSENGGHSMRWLWRMFDEEGSWTHHLTTHPVTGEEPGPDSTPRTCDY